MDKDTVKLIEKIDRAKLLLEQAKIGHRSNCDTKLFPDEMKLCDCGAAEHNSLIDKLCVNFRSTSKSNQKSACLFRGAFLFINLSLMTLDFYLSTFDLHPRYSR